MSDQLSLDSILNDEKPEAREPAAPAEAPAVIEPTEPAAPPVERPVSAKRAHRDKEADAQGRERDPETGQYVPKTAPEAPAAVVPAAPAAAAAPVAPTQPQFTERERAFLIRAQDETRKRQELERQLAAAKPVEPEKQYWDDPEGAMKREVAKVRDEMRSEVVGTRLQTAETIARSRYTDFQEKADVFNGLVQQQPYLVQQMLSAPDPAEFVYRLGKNHQELQQAGGLDAMRAKIKQETEVEVRTKIEAELKGKADAAAAERAALPGSLSGARSSGVNRPVWGGPPSLEEILKD